MSPASPSPAAQQALDSALNAHDQGNLEKAETLYRQAITADGRMTVAHNNLGMVLIDLGRFEEAVASLRRALELDPKYAEAYNNLGFVFRKLSRDAEAADAYEHFLDLTPDVEDASKIRSWIEKVRAAQPAIAPAAAPAPAPTPSVEPPAAGGDAVLDLSKTIMELPPINSVEVPASAAKPDAEPLAEFPAAAAAPAPAGDAEQRAQADAEAEAFFGGASGGDSGAANPALRDELPPEAQIIYTEALTKFQDGELKVSAALCQDILKVSPTHFATLILMGRAVMGDGDFTRATTVFQKAVEARKEDPEALYFLGQSYEKRGLIEEAQGAYKRCLEAAPDGPRAKLLAKWMERDEGPAKVAGGTARCEFCMRSVPEQDLELHDNKRCCKQCLDTLGGKSADARKLHPTAPKAQATTGFGGAKRGGRAVKILVAVVLVLGLAAAGGYAAGLHKNPEVLKMLGLYKPPPPPPVRPNPNPNTGSTPGNPNVPLSAGKVLPTDISFPSYGTVSAWPLDRVELTVLPKLVWPEGKTEAPANAEAVKLELLPDKPEGMTLDAATGKLAWVPGLSRPVEPRSTHQATVRATCGAKISQTTISFRIDFPVERPREQDLRMPEAFRADGLGLVLADFDGDERPDVAAACGSAASGVLTIMLSGDGGRARSIPLSGAPMGLAAANFGGDARRDLCWVDWTSGQAGTLRGAAMAGAEKAGSGARGGRFSESLVLADLDGDGRTEYALASRREGKLTVSRADGSVIASAALPESSAPVVLVEASSPDGKVAWLGIVTSGGTKAGEANFYELAKGALVHRQKLELPAGLVIAGTSGDFTGKGRRQAALLYGGPRGHLDLLGCFDGKAFERRPVEQEAAELPLGLASADLNGDGRDDLVISSALPNSGLMRVLFSTGQGSFAVVAEAPAPGLAGPVAAWSGKGGASPVVAALNFRGRAWVLDLPARAGARTPAGGK